MPDPHRDPPHPINENPPESHEAVSRELSPLLAEFSKSDRSIDHQALFAFFENSPDPILLFNEKAELIAKNQRAIQFWDGTEDFVPPQLISEVHKVEASDSPFHEDKKNRLITIDSRGEQRYFLPTVFPLFDKNTDCTGMRYQRVIACILKDETVWERSERIRQNLLASISHELNTPLTAHGWRSTCSPNNVSASSIQANRIWSSGPNRISTAKSSPSAM